MGQKALRYMAGLIAGYLMVAYATGFGHDVTAATGGVVGVTKALQGR
jgi:hypothetical protein